MIKFILKWFFPPTFSFMFYICLFSMWFLMVPEWNRNWGTFQNYVVIMTALFSVCYLALDDKDGRFTTFHSWLEVQNKWIRRLVLIIILITWGALINFVSHHFPVIT